MANKTRERIDIYNIHREFQNRTIYRGEPINSGDYCLVVQIWVKNSAGHFLIQKRAETVKAFPGIWATTAGVVTSGETPRTGAIRELCEELGLIVSEHELLQLQETVKAHTLGTVFLLEKEVAIDELNLLATEVSQVDWASPDKIRLMVVEGSFYDYGDEYFARLFSSLRQQS